MKIPSKSHIEEMKRIAQENGGILQPEVVVQKASDPKSPLHSRFTWNDGEAAHQYRLWQARTLIRVSVEVLEQTGESVDVFVSLTTDRTKDGGGYRVMTTVLSDKQMRKQMLQDALDEPELFREKYKTLRELASVFAAIKKVRRKK